MSKTSVIYDKFERHSHGQGLKGHATHYLPGCTFLIVKLPSTAVLAPRKVLPSMPWASRTARWP